MWLNVPCPRCGGGIFLDDEGKDESLHEWRCLLCARRFDVDFERGTVTEAGPAYPQRTALPG
jgi:transposase-like protein